MSEGITDPSGDADTCPAWESFDLAAPLAADETRECPPGLGPRHAEVALLLARLAGASRTLLLYDATNDTARRQLAGLLASFDSVLRREPGLTLEVRADEIRFEGRAVYHDADCDRSLAARLYRDGARSLVFRAGLDARELARLLEILSIRPVGLPAHEDDFVTLFWKAGLRSVEVVAVQGPVPDDGRPRTASSAAAGHPAEDPERVLAALPTAAEPEWLEATEGRQLALRAEASSPLTLEGLRLLEGLVAGLLDPGEQVRLAEAAPLCRDTFDALLSAGDVASLLGFVRQMQVVARQDVPWDPERHDGAVRLLLSCGSDRAVRRLLHATPADDPAPRPELVELLDIVCPDPLTAVGEALKTEERRSSRAVARQLIEHYGRRREQEIRRRFDESRGRVAADYLRSLGNLEKAAALSFVARQTAHPDEEVREEALWHVERAAFSAPLGYALVEAVRRTGGPHRGRLLALVERSGDRRFVRPLLAIALAEGGGLDEAVRVASVVGRLERDAGLARWRAILTPKGRFFRRRLSGTIREQVVAAAAAVQAPGEDGARLVDLARSAARGEARAWMESLLAEAAAGGRR